MFSYDTLTAWYYMEWPTMPVYGLNIPMVLLQLVIPNYSILKYLNFWVFFSRYSQVPGTRIEKNDVTKVRT